MEGTIGLLTLILVPLIGSFVCRFTVSAGEKRQQKTIVRCGEIAFLGLSFVTLAVMVFYGILVFRNGPLYLSVPEICGRGLSFKADGFRVVYGVLAAFAWTVSAAFALWYMKGEENCARYFFYTLLTLSATLGVFLSADLYTTFVFFEVMSLASYLWVVHEEDAEAIKASKTYLAVAIIGGLVMLMGLFLLDFKLGTLEIDYLHAACQANGMSTELKIAGLCLLFGFGAKAGAFPLHIWLPKAHPVAPAPASALLSGILTKAGMYGILILGGHIFLGDEAFGNFLLIIAVCTMLVGAIGALFSVDMKHILACSSVSQIGFILTGAAAMCILREEQWLAVQGTILYMMNHSLFKLVLFLIAGVCVKNLKSRDLNKLRGFGAGKPWLMILFLIAALGIAGVPGFSGFVSKSMVHESVVLCYHESGKVLYKVAEILFLFAGGCTFAYMTKLFLVIFFGRPSKEAEAFMKSGKDYLPLALKLVLTVPAACIYLAGTLPEYLFFPFARRASSITGYHTESIAFQTFSFENIKGAMISVTIGLLLWFLFVKRIITKRVSRKETVYVNRFPAHLDLEHALYRPFLLTILPGVFAGICRFLIGVTELFARAALEFAKTLAGFMDKWTELLTAGISRTALKPVCETTTTTATGRVSKIVGGFLNAVDCLRRKWNRNDRTPAKDHVESVHHALDDVSETVKLASRSLSYGLLAFCVGLLAMLVYLLYCLQ